MSAMTPQQKELQKPARARASQIRIGMRAYIDTLGLIHQAWAERDDVKLGYPSWEAYYNAEFSEERVRLSPQMRDKAITELRIAGMSQRQIATSTGLSAATVNRHLNPVPDETDILEGDVLPPARPPLVEAMTGAIEDAGQRAQDHREPAPGEADDSSSSATGVGAATPTPDLDHRVTGDEADVPVQTSAADPESGPPTGSGSPNDHPPCEACGVGLTYEQWAEGFMRCNDCDPHGAHIGNGDDGCAVCVPSCPTCGQPLPT